MGDYLHAESENGHPFSSLTRTVSLSPASPFSFFPSRPTHGHNPRLSPSYSLQATNL